MNSRTKIDFGKFQAIKHFESTTQHYIKNDIKSIWRNMRDRIIATPPNLVWKQINGPIAATIALLKEFDWHPAQPNHWVYKDPKVELESQHAILNQDVSQQFGIIAAFKVNLLRHAWASAAQHYAGGGLDRGSPITTRVL